MKTLKAFSKSEDAYSTATLLGSQGIDAVVVDEGGLGGNLLGTTPNAIRIEVPEEQFEDAKQILEKRAEMEDAIPKISIEIENRQQGFTRTWYFDALIVTDLILLGLAYLTPGVFSVVPTDQVQDYLFDLAPSEKLWLLVYETAWGFFVISSAASLMIFFRLKLGRILYVGCLIWGAMTYAFVPPEILSPFGTALNMVWNLIAGMIVAMMFLSPVREEFRKRLTDS